MRNQHRGLCRYITTTAYILVEQAACVLPNDEDILRDALSFIFEIGNVDEHVARLLLLVLQSCATHPPSFGGVCRVRL